MDEWDNENLIDIFDETNVEEISTNRVRVFDEIHGHILFNLKKEITAPDVSIYDEVGIFVEGKAEFYLLEYENDYPSLKIGDVEIECVAPSKLLYFFVGQHKENIGLGYELEDWPCVRITGVKESNVLDYLDLAMFVWGIAESRASWPTCGTENEPEASDIHAIEILNYFKAATPKYFEPINAFNTGKRAVNKHECFLQYYKILEFFTGRAVDRELLQLRSSGLGDEDYVKEVKLISDVDERSSLEILVRALLDQNNLTYVRDVRGDKTITPKKLSKEIYDFRCSIVHAKEQRIKEIEPGERYSGEFVNSGLLDCTEVLSVLAMRKFSYD
jgi:hypothetical protein